MDHYLEITLLPDPEFTQPFLMGALYNKLHKALVSLNTNDIGVSFPGYSVKPKGLGNKLRVHGDKSSLSQLQQTSWLKGMTDHIELDGPKLVPDNVSHAVVKRKQFKTNVERLRRRRMKRKNETYEQATQAIPDTVERRPDLPFLMVRSGSTRQSFCLFIDQSGVDASSTDGGFNTYGLSQGATVPCF